MIGGTLLAAALWILAVPDEFEEPTTTKVNRATSNTWRQVRVAPSTPAPRETPQATRPDRAGRFENGNALAVANEPPRSRDRSLDTAARGVGFDMSNWPAEFAESIQRLERARQAVVTGQPVESWRFESVRAGYEKLLQTYQDSRKLSEVVQIHLADLGRLERAAEAARTIDRILNRSHQRDEALGHVAQSLANQKNAQTQSFRAVGMIQPSARRVEGRKLYSLISSNGSTRAYLDIPPGIDADALIARRVGVRGMVHYDEDLGARLISVRDLEEIKSRSKSKQ